MIIILAVLALIVVKALAESPWGVFTVCSTVPIALFMGIYMRFLRPGRVGEVSVIGIVLLVASIYFGGVIAHGCRRWGPALTFKDPTITFTLIGLPGWYLCAAAGVAAPRPARLPGYLPENRRYRRSGGGHC